MPLALLALAISSFGIGTTEFIINGLLNEVAGDLHVSISTAGLLTSGYALGVVVGGPALTALTARMPRKVILLALMALFIAGSLLSAVAQTYGLLMFGRIVSAFAHGAFFGVSTVVAADMVEPAKRARAISLMFTGLTLANVLGVPMGTLLGQQFGWRSTFWVVAALGLIGLIGIALLVPHTPADPTEGLRGQLTAFRRPQVWLAFGITAIGISGLHASFTYVTPLMTEVAGYSSGAISWLLVLFGVGLVIGNLLGGKAADRALMPTILVVLAGLAATLALFTITVHNRPAAAATLALLGGVGFATLSPLQMYIIKQAGGANALVSSANIAAFNIGVALGAWVGGLTISAGLGYASVNGAGALLTTGGLLLAFLAAALGRRTPATSPTATPATEPAPAPARN
ncbi:MFS transporter [Streptomyces rectiviolaceus]|uniref:MFS transporter n=1 Tax=Streptomyces rectiviolaceus TaxID=332591 RepID=A0ABP6MI53_9ACTN